MDKQGLTHGQRRNHDQTIRCHPRFRCGPGRYRVRRSRLHAAHASLRRRRGFGAELAQYKKDAAAWDARRDALSTAARIRPLRHRFRALLIPIVNETRGEARRDARHALRVLAAPGPAPSVAKRLHTRTRRFGDDGAPPAQPAHRRRQEAARGVPVAGRGSRIVID